MKIIPYNNKYSQDFKELNIEWLETYFYVEAYDLEVLSNPEKYIINNGGQIFFSIVNDHITGTVALMPKGKAVYELTKMAVSNDQRGKGIGQQLMQHCIAFAREHNFKQLLLYSNTVLENAIYIYKKWGFQEVELESDSSYDRANIKMVLHF